jgi:hypothetical protein
MRSVIVLLLLLAPALAIAQTTAPSNDRSDSMRAPVFHAPAYQAPAFQAPSGNALPPSMLLELRRLQTRRTLSYYDTVRGSDIQRTHMNDSVDREYADSAFALTDTAVSLSHKAWLDSELVEIPELVRFGSKVHFAYPPSIMVETEVQPVPFDTAILAHMNPISRENLPFFDQSPMPLPLRPARSFEGYIEAGAGNVLLPLLSGWLSSTISARSYFELRAREVFRNSSAIRQMFAGDAGFHTQLGDDPANAFYRSANLSLSLGYDSKVAQIQAPADTAVTDRRQSLFNANIAVTGDATDKLHYEVNARDAEFVDGYRKGLSESDQNITASLHYDPYISHFRFIFDGGYGGASLSMDTSGAHMAGAARSIRDSYVKALFGRRKGEAIEWYGGLVYMQGAALDGKAQTLLSPVARVLIPLNPRWELGGYYEPEVQLATLRALAAQNPFYSPYAANEVVTDSIGRPLDPRSAIMDRVRFGAFMNYALSPDDQIRTEVRWISRTNEPIFGAYSKPDATRPTFALQGFDTRRLQLLFGGNFLIFNRDVISSSIDYSSATIVSEDKAIPFEPGLKVGIEYHFNSIAAWLQPVLEFRAVSRQDRSITLLNVSARMELSPRLAILVRAENLAGNASDFWTRYEETPRSIWASLRYAF